MSNDFTPVGTLNDADADRWVVDTVLDKFEHDLALETPDATPSAEFLTDLLSRMVSAVPRKGEFLEKEESGVNSDLSSPMRLYAHLAASGSDVQASRVSQLLLALAEFTEADLWWLLVDGGRRQGIRSRLDATDELGNRPSLHHPLAAASAWQHGALPFKHVKAFLRNRSAAGTAFYADLIDFLAVERDNPHLRGSSLSEEHSAFEVAVRNPATPTAVLEAIVEHLRPEFVWVRLADTYGRQSDPHFSLEHYDTIQDASKAARRRRNRGPIMGDLEGWLAFVSLIAKHPNWVGGSVADILERSSQ